MQAPTTGRVVLVMTKPGMGSVLESNGTNIQPAMVNQAWQGPDENVPGFGNVPTHTVNVSVFVDQGGLVQLTSVRMFDTQEIAEAYLGSGEIFKSELPVAFWMPINARR